MESTCVIKSTVENIMFGISSIVMGILWIQPYKYTSSPCPTNGLALFWKHVPDICWIVKPWGSSFVSQTRHIPKSHTGVNCAQMTAAAWCASDSMLIASIKSCCPGRLEQVIHQHGNHILFMEILTYWPKIQILPTRSETDQHAVYSTLVRNAAEVAPDTVPWVQIVI